MKLLYLTDTQIRGINSENRMGDYYSDIIAKLKEVNSIAKKMKVDMIIHGGDLFDSAVVSNVIVDDVIDLIEKNKIKWYVVRGNHDEISNNPNLSKASSLDHCFRRSKYINHLDEINDKNIYIKSYDYYTGIEEEINQKGLITESKVKCKIAVVHAFLIEKPFIATVLHSQIQKIDTDYDIVLCGHNHRGWGIEIVEGIRFVNPSCIGRLKIDEIDITPRVVFINTDTDKIEFIPLKSAKPKEEVFDLTKVAEKKEFENEIDNFIASLETTTFTDLDVAGVIVEIGKQNKVDKEIVKELLGRVDNYKEE